MYQIGTKFVSNLYQIGTKFRFTKCHAKQRYKKRKKYLEKTFKNGVARFTSFVCYLLFCLVLTHFLILSNRSFVNPTSKRTLDLTNLEFIFFCCSRVNCKWWCRQNKRKDLSCAAKKFYRVVTSCRLRLAFKFWVFPLASTPFARMGSGKNKKTTKK